MQKKWYLCGMKVRWGILLSIVVAVGVMLTGCSSRALREAQRVVAQADSLRAEGVAYTDSVTMAEAYNTLEKWQYLYPTDYARACYYYGRLLRNNDDPVAAMQVFINATHTNTRDYHILARTYSNMGSICHLANEYQLAYDMYSRSADLFLKNGDTILYYHSLNAMALECAVRGQRDATQKLVQKVHLQCPDQAVNVRAFEMEAEMYLQRQQYDSALYYASQALSHIPNSISALLITAQSYSFMHNGDSAVYYAQLVLSNTDEPCNVNNALYILTSDDESKDKQAIRETAANRSDVQKILEIRQGKLSQATQLLEQDLHRRPNLMWLYAILGTCLMIGCLLWIYIIHKKKRHQLLSQQVTQLEDKHTIEQQRHAKMVQEHTEYENSIVTQIEQTCAVLCNSKHLKEDLCWSNFDQMCDIVNKQLYFIAKKLQTTYSLNDKEVRLCVLILIGISNSKQLADMLCYGESGIRNFKNRTAKKLSTNSIELRNKLLKIAIGEYSVTS